MAGSDNAMQRLPRPPLVFTTGAKQCHDRRLHRGGDVHGRRINADKKLRLRAQRRQLLEVQLAG